MACLIDSVYLFETKSLLAELAHATVKVAVATSVRRAVWQAAQIYPVSGNAAALVLSEHQQDLLRLLASPRSQRTRQEP